MIAISLGANCEITFNLRLYFPDDRSFPFDWQITPLYSIAGIIRNRFDFSISQETLDVTETRHSVINILTDVLHHHEFPRDQNGNIADNWRDSVDRVRDKYNYLANRMVNVVGQADKVLFVVNRIGCDVDDLAKRDPTLCASYIDIAEALAEVFPNLDFRLAVFNAPNDGVQQCAIKNPRIIPAGNIIDHGDRYHADPNHYAQSLMGWFHGMQPILNLWS